jgi:hypothetical protein
MKFAIVLSLAAFLAACAMDEEHNQKDIPVTTGPSPQRGIIVSAPAGTLGHGRF